MRRQVLLYGERAFFEVVEGLGMECDDRLVGDGHIRTISQIHTRSSVAVLNSGTIRTW